MNGDLKRSLEILKSEGRLLMECVAGSHLYNLNTESSDLDIRGVFAPTLEELIFGNYREEISDNDQDIKYYSLPKFIKLASECNPNIIELLFVPDDKLRLKSAAWCEICKIRDLFLSKRAKYTFSGYAYAQIKKSKGEGKKANSVEKYVDEEAIRKMRKALSSASDNEKCSLENKISQIYGTNFLKYLKKKKEQSEIDFSTNEIIHRSMIPPMPSEFIFWYKEEDGFQFRKIEFNEKIEDYDASRVEGAINLYRLYRNGTGFFDDAGMQIKLSSISKERELNDFAGVVAIDVEKYKKERNEYDSFWEWMANRNEARYVESWDKDKTCDMKNLMHCMRLLICAESIAKGNGPKVEFNGKERDYLLDIRKGNLNATDILNKAEEMMNDLDRVFNESNLQQSANIKKINEAIKKKVYSIVYKDLKESFFK